MLKLYKRSELCFAIIFIIIYCILQTIANNLNGIMDIDYLFNAIFNIALTVVLFWWVKKNGLLNKYGLCKSYVPAKRFFFYIPLIVISTHNLWNGAAINFNLADSICYICYMLCVGFVEELLFRGFLFRAIEKSNETLAVIISSVTFGLGHLFNLVNGAGMELVENICQVVGAIAVGFLFVVIFQRSKSLIPCIITHSAIDAISAFANEVGLTTEKRIILCLIKFVIVILYTLVIIKKVPKNNFQRINCPTEDDLSEMNSDN